MATLLLRTPSNRRHALPKTAASIFPGLLLCLAVSAGALLLERAEVAFSGRAWLETLVLAILLGTAVRTTWSPGERWLAGINFSAKTLLEVAVLLLGATISLQTILGAGGVLVAGIVVTVAIGIGASYGLGRAFGLPRRMATLIACGNSICGNSAIAAVAPVIGAQCEDVAASIAFTAVLGVAVVVLLPFAAAWLGLGVRGGGVLAGLTVYAVPQVLAAAAPLGTVAVQLGTLVKLVRVLMLGPVVMGLSLVMARRLPADAVPGGPVATRLLRFLPWFILGFLVLAGIRSAGWLPDAWIGPAGSAAGWFTIISMAALGLGVDLRSVARAGPRVIAVVTLSLVILACVALGVIRLAGIA